MYICSQCKELVTAKTKCYRIVTETREKIYPCRPKLYFGYVRRGDRIVKSYLWRCRRDDSGGKGREIAKEVNLCPKCALRQPLV